MSKKKLGLIFFPAFDWAISRTHPEREERLLYTMDQILEEGLDDLDEIEFFNPKIASHKDIKRTHFVVPSIEAVLTDSHLISSGAAIKAYNLVDEKRVNKAFSLTRPPGHHAMKVVYGDRGFCIVNNEAVMVDYIRQKYPNKRIAVIDTDAHHGDGTQDIFYNEKDVLFISIHQDGRTLYPGTGFVNELGTPNAYGYNINIPLPPSTTDEGYLYVIDNLVIPILEDFKPDIIINSAGQDNHYSDPLTNMSLSAKGYAILNEKLDVDVAVLEGGYSIEGALPYINTAIILAMAGLDYSNVIEPDFTQAKIKQNAQITSYIKDLVDEINYIWKNKEKLAKDKFGKIKEHKVSRRIYYDTSGIMENQNLTYKVCKSCQGLNYNNSKANRMNNLLIEIPLNACNSCYKEGLDMYKNAKGYDNVILQNRVDDEYPSK